MKKNKLSGTLKGNYLGFTNSIPTITNFTDTNQEDSIKEKQKTAVEWLVEQLRNNENIRWRGTRLIELAEKAKEMDKENTRRNCEYWEEMGILKALKVRNRKTFEQWHEEVYGGSNQLCCTPEGQIKRYVNCIGCDRKPLIQGGNK
jgi:hypothetical protein